MIFDFIVVGAGSAGCIVASRLSESGRHTVLLIEAGGKDDWTFPLPQPVSLMSDAVAKRMIARSRGAAPVACDTEAEARVLARRTSCWPVASFTGSCSDKLARKSVM